MREAAFAVGALALLAALTPAGATAARRKARQPSKRTRPAAFGVVDVSRTLNHAEGEETVAFNPNERADVFARAVWVARNGSLHPGRTVRVTPHSEWPTSTHRGHMPSDDLGLGVSPGGIGVSWDGMRGLYPDNVFRFIPLSAFR